MRRVSSEYGWVAARLAAFNLLSFMVIPLLTKTMGAGAYGYWSQFQAFIQFAVPLFTLNMQAALVRFLPSTESREKDVAFSSVTVAVAVSGVLSGAMILAARGPIAGWFFDGRTDLVVMLAIVFVAAALNKLFYYYLRARRYIRLHSLIMVAERVLLLLAVGGLVWMGQDIFWIVASSPISLIVFLVLLSTVVLTEREVVAPDWSRISKYAKFSVPLLFGGIGLTVIEVSDRYLIAFFQDMNAVGTYTTAYGLGRGFKLVAMPFVFVLPAVIAEHWDQGDERKVEELLSRSFRYFLLAFGLVAAVVAPAGRELLAFFSTSAIAAEGYLVVLLVGLSYLFYTVWFFYSRWLYLTERSAVLGAMWMVGGVVNVVLNVVLIPEIGVVGAAVATLASQALVGSWAFLRYHRRIRVNPQLRTVWGGGLAGGVTAAAVWWARSLIDGRVIYLVVAMLVGSLLYGTLAFFTGALRRADVVRVANLLRNAIVDGR